jgi:hypothetical protein
LVSRRRVRQTLRGEDRGILGLVVIGDGDTVEVLLSAIKIDVMNSLERR